VEYRIRVNESQWAPAGCVAGGRGPPFLRAYRQQGTSGMPPARRLVSSQAGQTATRSDSRRLSYLSAASERAVFSISRFSHFSRDRHAGIRVKRRRSVVVVIITVIIAEKRRRTRAEERAASGAPQGREGVASSASAEDRARAIRTIAFETRNAQDDATRRGARSFSLVSSC